MGGSEIPSGYWGEATVIFWGAEQLSIGLRGVVEPNVMILRDYCVPVGPLCYL